MTEQVEIKDQVSQPPFGEPLMEGLHDDEPSLDVPTKAVALRLVSPMEMNMCAFWVGMFKKGELKPPELLDTGDINEIFSQAATKGITEAGPLMLSDSSRIPARYVYPCRYYWALQNHS